MVSIVTGSGAGRPARRHPPEVEVVIGALSTLMDERWRSILAGP